MKNSEGDKYYNRNSGFFNNINNKLGSYNLIKLLEVSKIRVNNILEIGCADGNKLNLYKKYFTKNKKKVSCWGVDLSKKAILSGKKKYPNLNLYNYSSLEILKLNKKFDLIICGFFLYLLDRQYIFEQFDKITKLLNDNGFLIINDFEPIFPHFNRSVHNKSLNSYKMNYSKFLEASNYYKLIYKHKWETRNLSDKKFLSNDISVNLFKKVAFEKSFPRNI